MIIIDFRQVRAKLGLFAAPTRGNDPIVNSSFSPIEDAVNAIRDGRAIIVVDAEDRENEGDFICAAERITPELVNFMITHGRGQLCMPILPETNRREFRERHDTDFAYELPGVARFRGNAFMDRRGPGGVFRVIPAEILTAEKLGLSHQALFDVAYLSAGPSRRFADLPELELPPRFRRRELERWVERIESARARTIVEERLERWLARAG